MQEALRGEFSPQQHKPGLVVHACNSSTQKVEGDGRI